MRPDRIETAVVKGKAVDITSLEVYICHPGSNGIALSRGDEVGLDGVEAVEPDELGDLPVEVRRFDERAVVGR